MINLTFFGSSQFSVYCLDELKRLGLLPNLIITTIDKQVGRGLKLTPSPVKIWAKENNINCLTPNKLNGDFILQSNIASKDQLFLVASYGKIIPKTILDFPQFGTLNIHPSLLPKYRGPSPIQEQILNDERNVGVTLMLLDEEVDHGPIIAQEIVTINNWPPKTLELKEVLAKIGSRIFVDNLDNWVVDKIKPRPQDHSQASFTKKIKKEDGLIDIINSDPYKNFLKIQAYSLWPQTYFFVEKDQKKIRVIIKDAEFKDGNLVIKKVLPEGKKEMNYQDFCRGL